MIIGHYAHEIWANGGVATYIRRVSQAQQAAGHTVYFLSQHDCQGLSESERLIVTPTNENLYAQYKNLQLDILHLHSSLAHPPPTTYKTVRTLHGHHAYCPSGSRFLERWGKPCDRSYHPLGCVWGHFIDHCGSIRPAKLQQEFQETRYEMQTLHQIPTIAVSEFIQQQMLRAGYPQHLSHVLRLIPPTVSQTTIPPQIDIPRFIFLGRIARSKGLEWLLRAFQKLSPGVAHLDIAGSGPQEAEMQQLAGHLGIRDRVTFHGWVTSCQVNQLIQASRAVVFPSIWHEPGGTIAFEAMANARAVIMSRVGGMPEVVLDGKNGLLVEPNHTVQLTQAIHQLAADWNSPIV